MKSPRAPAPCNVLFTLWSAKTCPDPTHSLSSPGAAASEPQTEGAPKKWAVTTPSLPRTALGCRALGSATKTIAV